MSFLNVIVADLRERRLWPVAVVLAVAIVAVPFALAKHAAPAPPPAPAPSAHVGGFSQAATAAPAVTVDAALQRSKLTGPRRDPFQQGSAAKLAPTGSGGAVVAGSSGSTGAGSGGARAAAAPPTGGGTTASGGSGAAPAPAPAPAAHIPATHRPPAPSGLRPDQSYDVQLAVTRPDGGINTIGSLERLSVVPSRQNPLLVELGVLQGGRRVLFAVMPDARISGPGRCIPGPVDCELISLAPNQVESVAAPSGADTFAQFAVTGITAAHHVSVAAANAARRRSYDAGAWLLSISQLNALSLFQYQPGLGAVVDLRNLNGGGS
jgi:hypothetical protein